MDKIYRLFVLFFLWGMVSTICIGQEKIVEGGRTYYLHKVQKGEGFYRLSVLYQVAQKDIVDANPDLALQGLKEGSLVKVPVKPQPVVGDSSRVALVEHKVEKGQTLFAISRLYGVPVERIIALNPGVEQQLSEGAVIKLPASSTTSAAVANGGNGNYVIHTVAPGETLFRIAQNYQVALNDLTAANPVLNGTALSVGDRIRVPRKNNGGQTSGVDTAFLIHNVLPGETLFGISQKYGRSQVEIKLVNGELLKDGLHAGQNLRIPRQKLDLMLENKSLFIIHNVGRKETLYGISRLYGTDVEVIGLVNPNVDFSSVKKGTDVRIPAAEWYRELVKPKVGDAVAVEADPAGVPTVKGGACSGYDYFVERPQINVALLLPFDYSGHQMVKSTPDSLRSEFQRNTVNRSKPFVEFYEGALLALDSLKREGVSVNLFVHDTRRDSTNFSRVLQRLEQDRVNLIIGPVSIDQMKTVANYAKDKQVPAVFPFAVMDASIRSNPYVYQASPVDSLYRKFAVEEQMKLVDGRRVVVLTTGSTHPFELAAIAQIKQLVSKNGVNGVVFHRYVQREVADLSQLMDPDQETVVIIPSIEETRVSRMLTNLGLLAERSKRKLSVMGYAEWLKFQTIEPEDLHKLNTIILSSYGADYQGDICRRFSRAYRHWYRSEPVAFNPYFQRLGSSSGYSRFGMWGYDVTFYFVGAIKAYGPQFQRCLTNYRPTLVQSNFRFTHLTNWGGAANTGLMRIHFARDYQTLVSPIR